MKFVLTFSKSKQSLFLVAILGLLGTLVQHSQAVTLAVSGVYDENAVATNSIDSQALGNAMSSTIFAGEVSAAYAAGNGGVINFDIATDDKNNPASEAMIVNYGAGKSFNITSSSSYDIHVFGTLAAISGNSNGSRGMASASVNITDWTLNFGGVTGGSPGEAITTVGFTLLSRTGFSQGVIVNWFIDGSLTPYSAQTDHIADGGGVDDTFFSFVAPDDSYISGLQIILGGADGINDRRLGIDDIGFTTSIVPELSRALLLLLGGIPLCMLRRKNPRP